MVAIYIKEAIWQVDRFGGHAFVPGDDAGDGLFTRTDLSRFMNEIRGRAASDWITYGELEDWAQSDTTLFHSGQLKKALREMEAARLLEKPHPTTRTKPKTYPDRDELGVRFRPA